MPSSCVTDTKLSAEEEQILAQLKYVADDISPDSHACRLKLHLIMSDSSMPALPWDIRAEMNDYLKKRSNITSVCRLSALEEHTLLCLCQEGENPQIFNRFHYLGALLNSQTQSPVLLPPAVITQDGQAGLLWPGRATWDGVVDQSCNKVDSGFIASLTKVSYKRPKDMKGLEAVQQINRWLDNGLRLRGGKDDLGFLFYYELMTKTLSIKVLDEDNTYYLATSMIRLLPDADMTPSIMLSILRVLSRNPALITDPNIPRTSVKGGGFFFKGGDNPFGKVLQQFQQWLAKKMTEPTVTIDWVAADAGKMIELPMTVPVPDPTKLPRDLICPRLTNVGCSRMEVGVKPDAGNTGKKIPGLSQEDLKSFGAQPMSVIDLVSYVSMTTRAQREQLAVGETMPFDVSDHPIARNSMSRATIERLRDDTADYAKGQNQGVEAELLRFFEKETHHYVQNPSSPQMNDAIEHVKRLLTALMDIQQKDTAYTGSLINHILRTVNGVVSSEPTGAKGDEDAMRAKYAFSLARYAGQETTIWFEFLVGVLPSDCAERQIRELSPLLSPVTIRRAMDLIVDVLFHANRIGQTRRCIVMCREFVTMLTRFQAIAARTPNLDLSGDTSLERTISIKAEKLAQQLVMKRYFVQIDPALTRITFDPRFLVFEFTYNLMLRQSQIELIQTIMTQHQDGDLSSTSSGSCFQMIMGAGKTTVVGPLLALLLADGKRLVTQVVPLSLLEFSRSITRERFSAVIRKPVYTFTFDRFHTVTGSLYRKLLKAMDSRAVLISTSTALKAFQLKFVELLHQLDQSHTESKQFQGKAKEKAKWLDAEEEAERHAARAGANLREHSQGVPHRHLHHRRGGLHSPPAQVGAELPHRAQGAAGPDPEPLAEGLEVGDPPLPTRRHLLPHRGPHDRAHARLARGRGGAGADQGRHRRGLRAAPTATCSAPRTSSSSPAPTSTRASSRCWRAGSSSG